MNINKYENINARQILPPQGLSRFGDIKDLLPFGKTRFEEMVKQGRAPQKIKLGNRCTFYKNSEILQFLDDIVNYRADGFGEHSRPIG